jgi:hypothetical protein
MLDKLINFSGVLQVGSVGAEVAEWQGFLKSKVSPAIVVDGKFGPITKEATAAFQQGAGIMVDGKVGRQTLHTALVVLGRAKPEETPGPGRISPGLVQDDPTLPSVQDKAAFPAALLVAGVLFAFILWRGNRGRK